MQTNNIRYLLKAGKIYFRDKPMMLNPGINLSKRKSLNKRIMKNIFITLYSNCKLTNSNIYPM